LFYIKTLKLKTDLKKLESPQKIDHTSMLKMLLLYLVNHITNFREGDKFVTYGELAKNINYPKPYTGSLFSNNIGHTL